MNAELSRISIKDASPDRRDLTQSDVRMIGHVVRCGGARATLSAIVSPDDGVATTDQWVVGRMISINLDNIRTVGLVYEVARTTPEWCEDADNPIEISIELVGEVRDTGPGAAPIFDRGITRYPHIGAIAHRIRARDLQAIYDLAGRQTVNIGNLSQDESIEANIAIQETLTRHFAVVGTTGVGKSTAVSILLRRAVEAREELRVLIFDPHNEFGASLGDLAFRIDAESLDLPFWMFRLEEFAEVLFRGREIDLDEIEILRDIIPLAKQHYKSPGSALMRRGGGGDNNLTADTPMPYRMVDLLKLLDERMGALDSKSDRPVFRSLKARIESAISDPRYKFMFGSRMIEDTIHETMGTIFRLPHHGKPITCFEMAGMPSEIVNAVCSVLARLAFDLTLWAEGRMELLVLCEEAHRYMPADPKLGFAPTRHALSRIAKEGRKYGCYLGVVTQRPGELDPTILSQCSTVFAMRLANEKDQAIIRSAIADSSASTLAFLSSMGQREAIAFGEGVSTTMRLKFVRLKRDELPGRHDTTEEAAPGRREVDLAAVISRLRNVPDPKSYLAQQGTAAEPPVLPGAPYAPRPPVLEQPQRETTQQEPAPARTGFGLRSR